MTHTVLALPSLPSSIPIELYIPGENRLAVPLAIALLEAGVANDSFFDPGRHAIDVLGQPDERELCMAALTEWWTSLEAKYPTRHIRMKLHAQEGNLPQWDRDIPAGDVAWFCLSRVETGPVPRFSLARRVKKLEAVLPGFGQTVVALLRDAISHLPESFNPWLALDYAEWLHWGWTDSDEELLANRMEEDDCTLEEAKASVMTREEFYSKTPTWLFKPKRTLTRKKILRAARDNYTKKVIAACDALSALASSPAFNLAPWDIGIRPTQLQAVEPIFFLHWDNRDEIGRVIDDALEQASSTGEYCDLVDIACVPLTREGITAYLYRIEQVMHLAMLTENLLILLGGRP